MTTIAFKSCPRCKGDIAEDGEGDQRCLQCGYYKLWNSNRPKSLISVPPLDVRSVGNTSHDDRRKWRKLPQGLEHVDIQITLNRHHVVLRVSYLPIESKTWGMRAECVGIRGSGWHLTNVAGKIGSRIRKAFKQRTKMGLVNLSNDCIERAESQRQSG